MCREMQTRQTISIVICGWHFGNPRLFEQLIKEAAAGDELAAGFYVASHKAEVEVDRDLLAQIRQLGWRVLFFENEGWEWGAYQQFLRWQAAECGLSDYYLFIHDDVIIKRGGFLTECLNKIRGGASVVGNSTPRPFSGKKSVFYPEDVFWSKLKGFPIGADDWRIVRGSFIFTTRRIAEQVLIKMPIKTGPPMERANSSLRVFGGLVAHTFGGDAITYLGENPLESDYVVEEERGGKHPPRTLKSRIKRLLPPWLGEYISRMIRTRSLGIGLAPPIPRGTGLRLNVGCGQKPLCGYVNLDIDSPCAEMQADIRELDFEEGSIAEILMVHVIEHFEADEAEELIRKMFRWLRKDGQLILEFPDIVKCARLILRLRKKPEELQTSPRGVSGIFGGSPRMRHKWAWAGQTMSCVLKRVGFRKIYVERARFHMARRDVRVIGVKGDLDPDSP
jgi:SAM-dependent methyltransferase